MNSVFRDESITIKYIQKMLNETYNDSISVTGEYYETFDMNYGFAHYIVKYLDYMYPVLDKAAAEAYKNLSTDTIATKDQVISISNYFLCDNNGNRLQYDPTKDYYDDNHVYRWPKSNNMYASIYNPYMRLIKLKLPNDSIGVQTIKTDEVGYEKTFIINNDLPIFTRLKNDGQRVWISTSTQPDLDDGKWIIDYRNSYELNTNTIFRLFKWAKKKEICEIDDLVASYLLGKTIGPNSSMEDIHYAQKLLIRNRNIQDFEKGIWCPVGYEGTIHDMTVTVSEYQKNHVKDVDSNNVFVTGYFDIYTEACIIKEVGDDRNGILGL